MSTNDFLKGFEDFLSGKAQVIKDDNVRNIVRQRYRHIASQAETNGIDLLASIRKLRPQFTLEQAVKFLAKAVEEGKYESVGLAQH